MSIATCPKCHRQVSLPNTDDRSVWVRCPLCGEQYALQTALDHVPPLLEILGARVGSPMAGHGDMPVHVEVPFHHDLGGPADTLAHPEHGATLEPLSSGQYVGSEQGANGEHAFGLTPPAPSGGGAAGPPALDRVAGEPHEMGEHLVDFDLESAEHGEPAEHDLAEHSEYTGGADEVGTDDPAAAAFGEFHGEHVVHPSHEHGADGAAEFQFADGETDAAQGGDTEHHEMGGIATMVQTAPPVKQRRKAPLGVKLIGLLLFFGFGLLGCYLVYGAFMFFLHEDQFGLKQFFPAVIRNRVAEAPAKPHAKSSDKDRLIPAANPGGAAPTDTAPTGTAGTSTPPAGNNPGVAEQPSGVPPSAGPANPAKPAPGELAKGTPPVESSGDPTKPPPDFDKPDSTKPDLSKPDTPSFAPPNFAPPKADTPTLPPDKTKPPEKTAEKPVVPPEKAVEIPIVPPEKPAEKPVIPPEKPAEHPAPPAEAKTPLADQLANVDAALAACTQAAESLKSAVEPGADPKALLKAHAPLYKAMSHLATELGAVDDASADPIFAEAIEQLRKKAAALAATMGSPAERDTTAKLASMWIASQSRKEGGAVIVGTLVKVEPADKGFVAHVKLPSDAKEMTFATAKKPEAADGSPVVVLALLKSDAGGRAIEIVATPDAKSP